MAFSTQRITSDGTLVLLDISIEYFDRSEIAVLFNGVVNAYPWSWVGLTESKISFSPAVPNTVEVMLVRTTDLSQVRHMFTLGAQFTTESLDEDLLQILHIAQEAKENATIEEVFNNLNMHGYRIVNIGDGVNAQDAPSMAQMVVHDAQIVVYRDQAAASAAAAAASAASVDISAALTAERTAVATLSNKTLTAPTLTTPALGTPASGNLANCTFPTLNQSTTGSAASVSGTTTAAIVSSALGGGSPNSSTYLRGDRTWQTVAVGINPTYLTTPNPINVGVQTMAHGLGAVPKMLVAKLLVTTPVSNWAVGDVIEGLGICVVGVGNSNIVVGCDATNVVVGCFANAVVHTDKSTGAVVINSATNFKVIVGVSL